MDNFIKQEISEKLATVEALEFTTLEGKNIIFIIDTVKGFVQKTTLNPEDQQKINNIVQFIQKALEKGDTIIALNDAHNDHSPEFETYQVHCLEHTADSKLIDELEHLPILTIEKNSTNGFFAFDFKPNLKWDNIIVIGLHTDTSLMQFALSCKTWFNQHNKKVNVYVPQNMTTTLNPNFLSQTEVNNLFWYFMFKNGIKIVSKITYE